jgi:hypothetical protein
MKSVDEATMDLLIQRCEHHSSQIFYLQVASGQVADKINQYQTYPHAEYSCSKLDEPRSEPLLPCLVNRIENDRRLNSVPADAK